MKFTPSWFDCTPGNPLIASAAQIEAEPMFYNATPDWEEFMLMAHPLTNHFITACRLSGEFNPILGNWSLDTRSTMLQPGWIPAIPGWHHDDVDRDATGQPIYHDPEWFHPKRRMITTVIEALGRPTGSRTEFVDQVVDVTYPVRDGKTVYADWDITLQAMELVNLKTRFLESGKLYSFGQQDFHRATPATSFGWRWFARLTINPGPRPAGPKIRRQVQIYTPYKEQGW